MAQRTFIVPALMVGFSAAFALPGPLVFPRQATEPDLNTHVYLDYCGDEVGLRTAVYFDKIPANPDVDSPIALSDTDVAWDAGNDATHRFYETGEADPVYWTVQDSTSKIRGGSLGLPVGSYVGQFELIRTEQDREYLDGLNCFVEPATSSITHPVFGYFCYPQALCTKRNAQQVTFSASRQTIEINTPTTGDGGNARTAKDIINRAAEAVNDDNRSCDPTPFSVSRGGTCTMVVDCNDPDGRAKEKFAAAIAAFADNEAGSSYRTEEIVGDGCIELGTCDHENCVGVNCLLTMPARFQANSALVTYPGSATGGNPENGEITIEISCNDQTGEDEAFCSGLTSANSLAGLIPVVGPLFSALGPAFSAACE